MAPEKLIQIENEVFTKIIMDELQRQKKAGTAIGDYLLDKYGIERQTIDTVKKLLSEEKK